MNLSPIILFVYNRPEHTNRTIEALSSNTLASQSKLIVYSDANKNSSDEFLVAKVRDQIKTISGFNEVKTVLSEKNLGLANSVISGVTEVVNEYGSAIVLEDDLLTSKYFLSFMNSALQFYKSNKKIYSISGYNFPIKIPINYNSQVYILNRPASWGWATWKDRWENAIWDPQDSHDIYNPKNLKNLMDKAGKDLAPMLLKAVEGKVSSWAVKWAFTHLKQDGYCLFPINSLVKNIGTDASGTNFDRSTNKYDVEFIKTDNNIKLTNELVICKEILDQVQKIVRPGLFSYLKYRLFNIY